MLSQEPHVAVNVAASTSALASYIAGALDHDLPAEAAERTKLHILDTIAAILSGSRLKAGMLAARYVDSLGGKPQAMVIGTPIADLGRQRGDGERHGGARRRDG